MSTEYISAIAILLATILPIFGIKAGTEELTEIIRGLVVGISGIYLLCKRYKRGGITPFGVRKAEKEAEREE